MIKRFLISAALVLTSINSWALESELQNFTCVTEFPTTSYVFDLANDLYSLDVIHHNGVEHAPIHSGLITIATIDYLQESIKNVKLLGERITFKFKPSECNRLEENRITCYVSGKNKLGSLDVEDVYFNVYENSDSSTYGVFNDVRVSLEYRVKGRTFYMPMHFPKNNCSNRFNNK